MFTFLVENRRYQRISTRDSGPNRKRHSGAVRDSEGASASPLAIQTPEGVRGSPRNLSQENAIIVQ